MRLRTGSATWVFVSSRGRRFSRGCRYTATDFNGHTGYRTVEQAAEIVVQLATSDDAGQTGKFLNDRRALPVTTAARIGPANPYAGARQATAASTSDTSSKLELPDRYPQIRPPLGRGPVRPGSRRASMVDCRNAGCGVGFRSFHDSSV